MCPQGARALRGRVPCVGAEEVCSEPPLYIVCRKPYAPAGNRARIEYENAAAPSENRGSAAAFLFVLQWQSWFFSVFKRVLIRGYALV